MTFLKLPPANVLIGLQSEIRLEFDNTKDKDHDVAQSGH
jgi:hypothetical protein